MDEKIKPHLNKLARRILAGRDAYEYTKELSRTIQLEEQIEKENDKVGEFEKIINECENIFNELIN